MECEHVAGTMRGLIAVILLIGFGWATGVLTAWLADARKRP